MALIIANKSPDWRAMAVALGDQLLKTEGGEKVSCFEFYDSFFLFYPHNSARNNGDSALKVTRIFKYLVMEIEINSFSVFPEEKTTNT